jgi:Recombinase zinc beta ribbon domain
VAAGYSAEGVSVKIRRKARNEWLALKPNTHDGYVSWERFAAIRTMVSGNGPTGRHHGAPKRGDALLAGLIRCKRCGRKLTLRYSGMKHHIPRYSCSRAWMDNGGPHGIGFGGLRVDDAIEEALLGVVGPGAIAAATAAAKEAGERRDQVRDALRRDLEAARYAADRAFRQFDAADPANRLVASELEARWNRALGQVAEVEGKLAAHDASPPAPALAPASLGVMASNLRSVWSAPTTDARVKKRIVRTLIHEVVADIDDAASEIVLIVHWVGGAHSALRLPKRRRGQRNSTSADIIQAVRQLVLIASDDLIAGLLNRNGLKTGKINHIARWVFRCTVVEKLEVAQALELLAQAVGGWIGGVLQQGQVHPLMPPVLLRLAGRNALGNHTGLDQLDRQLRQSAGTTRWASHGRSACDAAAQIRGMLHPAPARRDRCPCAPMPGSVTSIGCRHR